MEIPDQRPVWDKKHADGDHEKLRGIPSPFALRAEPYLPRNATILELGCGVGRDADFFVSKGHNLLATDGSEFVIKQNTAAGFPSPIDFAVIDIRERLPYADDSFDVVYSNLALHYYSDEQTRAIIKEIRRVIKSSGLLAFACKSYDSAHNTGKQIQKNTFVSDDGTAIHLFSTEYVTDLLRGMFEITYLDEVGEEYNGRTSKIVQCVAKKQ